MHSDGVKHVAYCWRISGLVHLDLVDLHLDLSKNLKFLGLRKIHSKSFVCKFKIIFAIFKKIFIRTFSPNLKQKLKEREWVNSFGRYIENEKRQ